VTPPPIIISFWGGVHNVGGSWLNQQHKFQAYGKAEESTKETTSFLETKKS